MALSGGCLRSLARIGVLKALASQGLRPDLVVGTSVGAVIGGLSAAGCPPEEIERAALDMDCARATVLTEGEAADAVVSSAAMPGFFVPAVREGRILADGCLTSPLPVRIVRALGAQRLIAVNTLFDSSRVSGLGLFDATLRAWRVMVTSLANGEAVGADLVIASDFARVDRITPALRQARIDTGEREAYAALRGQGGLCAQGGPSAQRGQAWDVGQGGAAGGVMGGR